LRLVSVTDEAPIVYYLDGADVMGKTVGTVGTRRRSHSATVGASHFSIPTVLTVLISCFLFPFLFYPGLFFLFVDVFGEGGDAFAPAGVVLVELDLFVEVAYAVIEQLVRVVIGLYVKEGVPQFVAQYLDPVEVRDVLPAFPVESEM
jgi:hypothetical protein